MKRLLSILALAVMFHMSLFAQNSQIIEDYHDDEGLIIGGVLGYWQDNKATSMNFKFSPELAWRFNGYWALGLQMGVSFDKKKGEELPTLTSSLKVAPFARYYYYTKGNFNLYLDGGFAYNFSTKKIKDDESFSRKGFELGIRPGACFDISRNFCLCMRAGFFGYRDNFFMGDEEGIASSGFGFLFAPEDLSIGLELEF